MLTLGLVAQGTDSPNCTTLDQGDEIRILLIGNSYSFYNDLPDLLASLVSVNHMPAQAHIVARNGASLEDHWRDGDAVRLLRTQPWDFVLLQERSSIVRDQTERAASFATLFDREIRSAGAKTLLYVTPARKGDHAMQEMVDRGYERIARNLDATIVPVGSAFQRAYAEMPEVTLYAADGIHPSLEGTWLATYVFYMALFEKLPERTACGDRWPCLSDKTEGLFRRSATAAIREPPAHSGA